MNSETHPDGEPLPPIEVPLSARSDVGGACANRVAIAIGGLHLPALLLQTVPGPPEDEDDDEEDDERGGDGEGNIEPDDDEGYDEDDEDDEDDDEEPWQVGPRGGFGLAPAAPLRKRRRLC